MFNMKMILQPFHFIHLSPWPMMCAVMIGSTLMLMVYFFHKLISPVMLLTLILNSNIVVMWWRDVIREATYLGFHTFSVRLGVETGMVLFISSEVFFYLFFGLFSISDYLQRFKLAVFDLLLASSP